MATEAQIAANRSNAQSSTGPATGEGKSHSAANGITLGLFTVRDFVRSEESAEYTALCDEFKQQLQPVGIVEETLATEIIHAAWRLQRCSKVEASLSGGIDPMGDSITLPTQNAVDRARAQTHRSLMRLLAELRRFQTERQLRQESLPSGTPLFDLGLASLKDIRSSLAADTRAQIASRKLNGFTTLEAMTDRVMTPPITRQSEITEQSQSATPRSAACPCGSGLKYKRCCGVNAPAVLKHAA